MAIFELTGNRPARLVPRDDRPPCVDLRFAIVTARLREQLLAHYLRLSPEDRRMRFMRVMADESLAAHVAALDLAVDSRVALLDRTGALVALGEGFCYAVGPRRDMEVAFSTDAAWRRRGLARHLWSALARRAGECGVERVVLHCDHRNVGMCRLLRSMGAATHVAASDVSATWPVAQASVGLTSETAQ